MGKWLQAILASVSGNSSSVSNTHSAVGETVELPVS